MPVEVNESFFKLDRDRIDEYCLTQSDLMKEYGDLLAESKRDLDEAEATFSVKMASLDKRIRKSPETFGIESKTETAVKNAVIASKTHKKYHGLVLDARYAYGVLQSTVKALDHRKRMLELLTQLHGQQYFSVPSVTVGSDREFAEKYEKPGRRAAVKKRRR